ncbi:hypothetical protein [Absidia glauca]|uniref:ASX DEUBAD domain-containing protein n=1 Tax=Absidia glauca TaxID=4829 RepID=A0A168RA94_ABSGL|nr:hypothetical protein [Absidia glauca]
MSTRKSLRTKAAKAPLDLDSPKSFLATHPDLSNLLREKVPQLSAGSLEELKTLLPPCDQGENDLMTALDSNRYFWTALNDWQALLQSGHLQPSRMTLTDKDLAQIPYKDDNFELFWGERLQAEQRRLEDEESQTTGAKGKGKTAARSKASAKTSAKAPPKASTKASAKAKAKIPPRKGRPPKAAKAAEEVHQQEPKNQGTTEEDHDHHCQELEKQQMDSQEQQEQQLQQQQHHHRQQSVLSVKDQNQRNHTKASFCTTEPPTEHAESPSLADIQMDAIGATTDSAPILPHSPSAPSPPAPVVPPTNPLPVHPDEQDTLQPRKRSTSQDDEYTAEQELGPSKRTRNFKKAL